MLERVDGLPETVLGFSAKGTVTAEDYEQTMIPAIEEALRRHDKIRFLYHLGADFEAFEAGALWDDAKVGFRHLTRWERIAVVSDVEWLRIAVRAFGFAIPGEVRLFRAGELEKAREWIVA